MKRFLSIAALLLCLPIPEADAFCGMYAPVRLPDQPLLVNSGNLYNRYSQVVMVRDGLHTTLTMSSDVKGEAKDFALVIPVPVVLQKNQIRVVDPSLIQRLDAFSSPRLYQEYDENPCQYDFYDSMREVESTPAGNTPQRAPEPQQVKVEATYAVGEYEITLLSAAESGALEAWLTRHGYSIPAGAQEVLEPYIRSQMKFFVARVNLEKHAAGGYQSLRPLQISFDSPKFMLPIRLGMANAQEDQDLVVYAFTRNGKVEATNYRNLQVRSGHQVPEFIAQDFPHFYADLFTRQWNQEGRSLVFHETSQHFSTASQTAWGNTGSMQVLTLSDLQLAGVNWLVPDPMLGYYGSCHFTRMHIRYNRQTFAQDLMFQETPSAAYYTCSYTVKHATPGYVQCEEGNAYVQAVLHRRLQELMTLQELTGWDMSQRLDYLQAPMRRYGSSEQGITDMPSRAAADTLAPVLASLPTPGAGDDPSRWNMGAVPAQGVWAPLGKFAGLLCAALILGLLMQRIRLQNGLSFLFVTRNSIHTRP